jgi:hypothetical protein
LPYFSIVVNLEGITMLSLQVEPRPTLHVALRVDPVLAEQIEMICRRLNASSRGAVMRALLRKALEQLESEGA